MVVCVCPRVTRQRQCKHKRRPSQISWKNYYVLQDLRSINLADARILFETLVFFENGVICPVLLTDDNAVEFNAKNVCGWYESKDLDKDDSQEGDSKIESFRSVLEVSAAISRVKRFLMVSDDQNNSLVTQLCIFANWST